MVVTTLRNIEERARKNSSKNKMIVNNFQKRLESRGFKKGRVRPRNPIEQQILNSFKHK